MWWMRLRYPDYIEDLDAPLSAAELLEAATKIKDSGNASYKSHDHVESVRAYTKAIRYCDATPSTYVLHVPLTPAFFMSRMLATFMQ